jgi:hypothetical protein
VDHLAIGPAAEASPKLFRLRACVAFHPDDAVALNVQQERAPSSAIKGGSGPDDPNLAVVLAGPSGNYFSAHYL